MISSELLNVMSVDELRNYANHANTLIGSMNELFYAKNELIGSLQRCFNDARFEAERDKEYQNRRTMLLELEDVLLKKHYNELYHSISDLDGFFANGQMVYSLREEKDNEQTN